MPRALFTSCRRSCFFCRLSVVFLKQKTADEMRISDWSSDVCSYDLRCGWLWPVYPAQQRADPEDGLFLYRGEQAVRRALPGREARLEEGRVGKEGDSTCRYRWSPYQ